MDPLNPFLKGEINALCLVYEKLGLLDPPKPLKKGANCFVFSL
ncbi:hypothetical protein CRD_00569 [Raphidiopsis brookii D9]|nr:hypothetical protein CRD_00569 [Raphidiopsis brookii D9]